MKTIRQLQPACLILLAVLIPGSAWGAELSLFGGFTSGDYGTGVETESQATVLRFFAGDRFQTRIEASMLRVKTTETIVRTGVGSIPAGSGRGRGSGSSSTDVETVDAWSTGLGDVRLGGYFRLLGGGVKIFRLDTGLELKAPTADEEEYLGTGEWDYRAVLSGEYRFWTASVFGTVGWNMLGDPAWAELNDVFDMIVGVDSEPILDRLIVSGWLEGSQEVIDGTGNRSAIGIGLRSTGRWRWRVLATAGLSGAAEDFGVAVGMSVGVEPPKTGIGGLRL